MILAVGAFRGEGVFRGSSRAKKDAPTLNGSGSPENIEDSLPGGPIKNTNKSKMLEHQVIICLDSKTEAVVKIVRTVRPVAAGSGRPER
jgi:hypothetical protein